MTNPMTALGLFTASLADAARVLVIGDSSGQECELIYHNGHAVETCDWSQQRVLYEQTPMRPGRYDGIWCSHTLEHCRNVGDVLDKLYIELTNGGVLGLVVPPLKHEIVGGHLSLWNAGLLLYNLVRAGFDCREAAVRSYAYNVAVVVRKVPANYDAGGLTHDNGDIETLAPYFPLPVQQGFDGRLREVNWQPRR